MLGKDPSWMNASKRRQKDREYLNRSPQRPGRRPSFPKQGPYFSLSSGRPPAQGHTTPLLPKPLRLPLGDLPVAPQNGESRDVPYNPSHISANDPRDVSPSANRPLMPPFLLRSIPPPDTTTPKMLPSLVIPDASPVSSAPSTADDQPTTSPPSPPPETPAHIVPSSVAAAPSAAAPAKVTMVRGRRSPFRDGRRFIPLDDDESDSDDD
ncbi:hypothetical protein B0H12DRAFT_853680 [Mycena haematopus]|nr:hypothetical protein B0H12DRAFT_853680 [Mycena haematopus]